MTLRLPRMYIALAGSLAACALGSLLLAPSAAQARIAGGGSTRTDCFAEFEAPHMRLNYPPFDPAKGKPGREVRCFDGQAGCDQDGVVDGQCVFDLDVCLQVADPALPACTTPTLSGVVVSNPNAAPELAALQNAIDGILAEAEACTSGVSLTVALGGPTPAGIWSRGKGVVKLAATGGGLTDVDVLRLSCLPAEWPSYGHDDRHTRNNPLETVLGPSNAANLTLLWEMDLDDGVGDNGVTSTPTVGNGRVYVTSWNGLLYALDRGTGAVKWSYDTGSAGSNGLQSSATLTADGRVVVGDSAAVVHCLDAKKGTLLWTRDLNQRPEDHIWGSPTVDERRVYVPIASHADQPCTQGRVVALDLDTGVPLWSFQSVPEKVCRVDTTVTCAVDGDCPSGACITARGAGFTAAPTLDPSGDHVYANPVGCYTFPAVGDANSILKLDAATGEVVWRTRLTALEQFGYCSVSRTDCGEVADCPAGESCTTKPFYHDFAFLNPPLVVDVDNGLGSTRPLVVSGSKDGTLYALDPDTGLVVWANAVVPLPLSPNFGGFGLFNGMIGFADDRFFGALYEVIEFIPAGTPATEHLQAFRAVDGTTAWTAGIGKSWARVGLGGGLVMAGSQVNTDLHIHDAASGAELKRLAFPSNVVSGPAITGSRVYVGWGVFGVKGGVRAYGLP